jgi:cobalt-zinc-cadmium efflux system protein
MALSDNRRLQTVLWVAVCYFVMELAGGLYAGSLALITDSFHMLTDIAAICLSLLALWIAARPAHSGKTFGYLRAEILGALLNGLLLWVIVVFILIEAWHRIGHPHEVAGLPVMVVAAIGVAVNSFSAWMTHRRDEFGRRGMAVRAVFVHVLSDLIGSIGVLAAGAFVFFTGLMRADPIVSILIAGLIVVSSWSLVREGVDILMESTPAGIDMDELRADLLRVAGTEELHDLHVWCLTSREFALSAHAVVNQSADSDRVLSDISRVLESKFRIRHMTVQIERDSRRASEPGHF